MDLLVSGVVCELRVGGLDVRLFAAGLFDCYFGLDGFWVFTYCLWWRFPGVFAEYFGYALWLLTLMGIHLGCSFGLSVWLVCVQLVLVVLLVVVGCDLCGDCCKCLGLEFVVCLCVPPVWVFDFDVVFGCDVFAGVFLA